MPIKKSNDRTFDARPDRIDLRDRQYNPPLISLPAHFPDDEFIKTYLPRFSKVDDLILDQGTEGACTGFGLGAVVNYLLWKGSVTTHTKTTLTSKPDKVSPRMLYHMARIYDEWPGEDYEGSSCRGAMKGWHRHGVCREALWPYRDKAGRIRFIKPKTGWQQDAAQRPLGAYYRINKDSISDMQAAIVEVGAIYVSASVHDGWFLNTAKNMPTIKYPSEEAGGHAFAMVGYTSKGFIVQNSWGPDWGYHGFAVMTYQDWVQNGSDAWVVALGAPMEIENPGRSFSSQSVSDINTGKAEWFWKSKKTQAFTYQNKAVMPWSESTAYEHTLVLGNNGQPLNRLLDEAHAVDAVNEVIYNKSLQWLSENRKTKIALYAHGGLNSEADSINRIRVMAPYFKANGIYPIFITWRTGFVESIGGMLDDAAKQYSPRGEAQPVRGWWEDLRQQMREALNRTIESAADNILVKPIWTQMKQNAAASAEEGSGISLLAKQLVALRKAVPDLEIHLVGHSAGSIIFGHFLEIMAKKKMNISSLHLYAPACTVKFALDYYAPLIKSGLIPGKKLYFDLLSDEREQADTVGPYGKSLLYLVSRALEDMHKMPLLGLDAVWNSAVESADMFHSSQIPMIEKWRETASAINPPRLHGKDRSKVWDGQASISLSHGSFDNDIEVITTTLERISGSKLKAKVENLHWE